MKKNYLLPASIHLCLLCFPSWDVCIYKCVCIRGKDTQNACFLWLTNKTSYSYQLLYFWRSFFFLVWGFKLRTLHLLDRCSTVGANVAAFLGLTVWLEFALNSLLWGLTSSFLQAQKCHRPSARLCKVSYDWDHIV
jgi:hypothetical protein